MSQKIQLIVQAAENGNRRDVPGTWTPESTLSEIALALEPQLGGTSLENATLRYLQNAVPQSLWLKTRLRDIGLSQGGRALLILKLGSESQKLEDPPSSQTELERSVGLLLNNNFDENSRTCILTLLKVLDNVMQQPQNPKVRSIRLTNAAFAKKVANWKGGVEILLSCGFQREEVPPPLLSQVNTGEECLVLKEEMEDTKHLVIARRLLVKTAVEELDMDADALPKYKSPPLPTNRTGTSRGNSEQFDPYKGHRFDAKSASIGEKLGPDSKYISNTEKQLEALQSQQQRMEDSIQKPLVDRQLIASKPNTDEAKQSLSRDSDPIDRRSDGSLLASQFSKKEKQRKQREEGGFTTKAMRDLEKLKKSKIYSYTQIRVQFSDGSFLEARFLPKESVEVVKNVVNECLLSTNTMFDLYIAPPRQVLANRSTLEEAGLVPAAKIFVSWKANGPSSNLPVGAFLKPELFHQGSSSSYPTAQSLVVETEGQKRGDKKSNTLTQESQSSREDEMVRRMMGQSGLRGGPKSTARAKGSAPKWFKK